MSGSFCGKCGDWATEHHTCPPAWNVWEPASGGDEDNASRVYGFDAESAAEKFMEDQIYYHGEWSEEATVFVSPASGGKPKKFHVTGEMVPQFHAVEVEEEDGE